MSIQVRLLLTVPETAADITEKLRLLVNTSSHQHFVALSGYFAEASGGLRACTIAAQVAPVQASGTVTCASVSAADTVTIDGVVLTAVNGSPSTDQFDMSGSDTADAADLVRAIGANVTLTSKLSASSALGVVTITALSGGTIGNSIFLATSNNTRLAKSGTALASGTNGTAYNFALGQ